jgi:type II secretory pathway pseudopilin PulG
MPFSLPMLIPIIVGVVAGVTCSRLYTKIRQRIANRQAEALVQLRKERLEEYRASFSQTTRTGELAYEGHDDETIRA